MAEQNPEIFTLMLAAFNERGLEGAVEFFDEDVEVYDPDMPEGTEIRGHAAVLRIFGEILDAFEEIKVEDFEVIPAGDRVVALIHTAGYGEGSYGRMDFEQRDAHVMTFRGGKITYWRLYMDQEEALADAGSRPVAGMAAAEAARAGHLALPARSLPADVQTTAACSRRARRGGDRATERGRVAGPCSPSRSSRRRRPRGLAAGHLPG